MWFWRHSHALVESRAVKSLASLQLVRGVAGADDLFEGTPGFCKKNNFNISWCCSMGGVSGSEIVQLYLFPACLLEFLEDHHRIEFLGAHLFLLKYGGSFDSVQVLFSPFDISKYPRLLYMRKLVCQPNFLWLL